MFDRLHALGCKIVVITDGPDGAYASDGNQRLKMPLTQTLLRQKSVRAPATPLLAPW